MNKSLFFDEQDVLKDDLKFDADSTEENIEGRSEDLFKFGGFVTDADAVVTPNGGFPLAKVDITSGIVYDSRGRRISFTSQSALPLVDVIGGMNYIVVAITNTDTTPAQQPITGGVFDTRRVDAATFSVLTTFVQGDTDGSGNPYVLIATAVVTGSMTITDERQFILDYLNVIADKTIIETKLADYLKQIIWSAEPSIYFDKDTLTLNQRDPGTFKLTGMAGVNVLAGLPLTLSPDPVTTSIPQVIIGTIVANVCTVTAVALGTFIDFASISNEDIIVLGYVDINDSFVRLQASTPDEIVLLSEEDMTTGLPRLKANENLWRRQNEAFQSFTPSSIDGIATAGMNLLTVSAGTMIVATGASYVGGRRINLTAPITLSALNTDNFVVLTGLTADVNVYMLRVKNTLLYRFRVQIVPDTAPVNSYLLSTVHFTAGVPDAGPTDQRKSSPVPEVSIIEVAAEGVKIGARLKNTTAPSDIGVKIVVEPGLIGFADGTVRQNLVSKILDFTQVFAAINAADVATGTVQTQQVTEGFVGLEPNSHYGIFATADNPVVGDIGTFNIVAVKIPFIKNVVGSNPGGGQYTYTLPGGTHADKMFYEGQRIRSTRLDYTAPQATGANQVPAYTQFTKDSDNPEIVLSVVANVVTTQLGSITAPVAFGAGTLTSIDKFRPDPTLTGIVTRYRLLGIVSTDGTAVPNTSLKLFQAEGDKVVFAKTNATAGQSKIVATGSSSQDWNLDCSNHAPVCSKILKYQGFFGFNFHTTTVIGFNTIVSFDGRQVSIQVGPGDVSAGPTNDSGKFIVGLVNGPIVGANITAPAGQSSITAVYNDTAFAGEVRSYMGFVAVGVYSTPSLPFLSASFSISGYNYDIMNEWCLQTISGGVGGFL